jgi:hypothetical protein
MKMTLANRVLKILNERGEETVDFIRAYKFIKQHDFKELFWDLGWNKPTQKDEIDVSSVTSAKVNRVAELIGFVVLEVVSKQTLPTLEKKAIKKEINNIVKNNMLIFHSDDDNKIIFAHSSDRANTEILSTDRVLFKKTLESLYFASKPNTPNDVIEKVNTALNY